jgi:membrane protease YdiL (CAAX protease family)
LYAVLGATVFGVGLPVYYEIILKKNPVSKLGITTKNLWISVLAQIVLAIAVYFTKINIILDSKFDVVFPLIALALAIGFFEVIFWRGWMLTKIEESFGTIPAIILSSALYSLYHIGYGMNWNEMIFLFFIGLMFAILFVLFRNIFVLWPIYQPFGQLITITKDGLSLPLIASVGFLEVLIAMGLFIFFTNKYVKKKLEKR